MSFPEFLKKRFKPLFDFKGSPHEIGLAFGLGVFLGVFPGTGAVAAAFVATALRLNLPIMVTGALLTNPFTAPFIYLSSYALGHWLLGNQLPAQRVANILLSTAAGNLILSACLAMIGYLVAFGLSARLRKSK